MLTDKIKEVEDRNLKIVDLEESLKNERSENLKLANWLEEKLKEIDDIKTKENIQITRNQSLCDKIEDM